MVREVVGMDISAGGAMVGVGFRLWDCREMEVVSRRVRVGTGVALVGL